jgi:pentapeptide MXKDX repeat protein
MTLPNRFTALLPLLAAGLVAGCGDSMKADKGTMMKGDAMKKDDGMMKGDAMKKDDGMMKKDEGMMKADAMKKDEGKK